jgi:ABC-type branched-subunit amino acid transport system substrate-binding protein
LRAVASTQPDLIYFAGDDPNGTYALQALASIPELKSVAFAGSDGIVDNDLPQAAAHLHLNAPVYGSLPVGDPSHVSTSAGADFEANYTANGFTNYRPYAASAYDCTMMLIAAIKVALQQGVRTPQGEQDQAGGKRFRKAVLQALTHISYTGATGKHSLDANGDTTNHTISIYQLSEATTQPTWAWLQQFSA